MTVAQEFFAWLSLRRRAALPALLIAAALFTTTVLLRPVLARWGETPEVDLTLGDRKAAAVAFSQDSSLVAVACLPSGGETGGRDQGSVQLWDREGGKLRGTLALLPGNGHDPLKMAFSPGSQSLAAGAGKQVRLWDVKSGRHLFSVTPGGFTLRDITFSPDGGLLAAASEGQGVELWDAATGEWQRVLAPESGKDRGLSTYPSVTAVAFSPSGLSIAATLPAQGRGGEKGQARGLLNIWEPTSGKLRYLLPLQTSNGVIAYSPDGKILAVAGPLSRSGGELLLIEARTGRVLQRRTGAAFNAEELAFTRGGRHLVVTASGSCHLFDVHNPSFPLSSFTTAEGERNNRPAAGSAHIVLAPDATRIAEWGGERRVTLRSLERL